MKREKLREAGFCRDRRQCSTSPNAQERRVMSCISRQFPEKCVFQVRVELIPVRRPASSCLSERLLRLVTPLSGSDDECNGRRIFGPTSPNHPHQDASYLPNLMPILVVFFRDYSILSLFSPCAKFGGGSCLNQRESMLFPQRRLRSPALEPLWAVFGPFF